MARTASVTGLVFYALGQVLRISQGMWGVRSVLFAITLTAILASAVRACFFVHSTTAGGSFRAVGTPPMAKAIMLATVMEDRAARLWPTIQAVGLVVVVLCRQTVLVDAV